MTYDFRTGALSMTQSDYIGRSGSAEQEPGGPKRKQKQRNENKGHIESGNKVKYKTILRSDSSGSNMTKSES